MLRDYQLDIARQAQRILTEYRIVYLAMEMRTGKTLTAFRTAQIMKMKNVLFVTKKGGEAQNVITSILSDFSQFEAIYGKSYELTVINYEQAGKLKPQYDMVIVDEAHCVGAYPKPSKRAKEIAKLVQNNYLMLLSGTPSPESKSQLFHQFWLSMLNPFQESNFHKWCKWYVDVKEKHLNGRVIKDYSKAKESEIMQVLDKYFIRFSQNDAGFVQAEVKEEVIEIEMKPAIKWLCDKLVKDKYYRFKDGCEIVCDSAVKLQSKLHQICSGTVITEEQEYKELDNAKAEYIAKNYAGKKIAVFYKFKQEEYLLKSLIKNYTDDAVKFNNSKNLVFISQVQPGSMGINLAGADILIFYNIDFSASIYWQARARIQSFEREKQPVVHWLFMKGGIERKIYKAVLGKKNYTVNYFKRDYNVREDVGKADPDENHQLFEKTA